MIHVAYRLWGGDGFFAKMLGTSMLSMFENTKEKVTVHIMHNDRLTPDNRGKFCYIAGQYNQQVEFHNVEKISGATLRKFDAVHPIKSGINASWYPLIVHEVFPNLDKLIFLGADTVFNIDIEELWRYNLDGLECPLGAVSEYFVKGPRELNQITKDGYTKHENYFNADVLLMRPAFFRENFELILNACKWIYDKGYNFLEQDVLNYLFSEKYLHLPSKFNVCLLFMLKPENRRIDKAIYHFSVYKPSLNTDDIFNRLYFQYFLKTPWANADMFGNLNKAVEKMFNQIQNNSRNNLLRFTNLLTRRKRAFLCDKNFIEPARHIFEVQPDELVVELPLNHKTLTNLQDSREKTLLFCFMDNYWQFRIFLLQQGFIENLDFVNGFMFLSESHGLKFGFDSKPLVQAL